MAENIFMGHEKTTKPFDRIDWKTMNSDAGKLLEQLDAKFDSRAESRIIYGIGSNYLVCKYSGIKTHRVLMLVSILTGLMSAVCAIFLTSRMGSTRPNVAQNYELDVIAMVVLGGVSTSGGTGRIAGPLLAVFIIGFLNYGLGLMNVSAQVILIILGLLLILSVLVMNLRINNRKTAAKAGVK